ncbi:hypothetical protein EZS27_009240 [termite gut metagenome]|uniref:DUF4361 domain-containing protein n=1 Tax=termite gut metagenome TaxID=433724 RepID=A0A5J4SB06_9ZZZZ
MKNINLTYHISNMKYLNILFVVALAIGLWSCKRDEIFEREQYKHVVALLSEGNFNIFAEEHEFVNDLSEDLSEGWSEGYIAASCGGSLPIAEPVIISLREDPNILQSYNLNSFDMDADSYVCYLSPDKYTIPEHRITIPAHERSGRMKIQIRTDGLSPDSVYFIPFRIEQASCEVNPAKNTVLYCVYLKNFYATTKSAIMYQHRGIRTDEDAEVSTNTMMQKMITPVSSNEVRIFVGNTNLESKEINIIKWSIRLTMDDDGHVTITPWDTSFRGVKVTQIDGDPEYPNVFSITDDGYKTYKTFLLCYRYADPDDGTAYLMREELRIEYKEEKNK